MILPHTYILLFPATFASLYLMPSLSQSLAIISLVASWYILILKRRIEPVILLCVYSRIICGVIAQGNNTIYDIVNIMVNYLPAFVFVVINWDAKLSLPWTWLYIAVLLIFTGVSGTFIVFRLRVIPMIMIASIIDLSKIRINPENIIKSFRYIFIVSILLYILVPYKEITMDYIEAGNLFKEKSGYIPLLGPLIRNCGPWWDPRIMGMFAYAYLIFSYRFQDSRFKALDVLIALMAIATTLSRGGMLVAGIILLGLLWFGQEKTLGSDPLLRKRRAWLLLSGVVVGVAGVAYINTSPLIAELFRVVEIVQGGNAVSQRSGFWTRAIEMFLENPLGVGVGSLRELGYRDRVVVGGASFDSITDAFIFIILAEVGIFGFIVFLASIFEIFYRKTAISLVFIIAFLLQITGTDIPDMGPIWFSFAILMWAGLSRAEITSVVDAYCRNRDTPKLIFDKN